MEVRKWNQISARRILTIQANAMEWNVNFHIIVRIHIRPASLPRTRRSVVVVDGNVQPQILWLASNLTAILQFYQDFSIPSRQYLEMEK